MPEKRNKYDQEFREGAVRIVNETNKPIAVVARDLGVNEGTLGHWVACDREARQGTEGLSKGDIAELKRDVAELKHEISGIRGDISGLEQRFAGLKGDVLLLKWMLGFVLAFQVAIFFKLFLQ